MQLNFNPEKHVYSLSSGEVLPSVTRIISPLYDFSAVPKDVLERSRQWGHAVHKTIELYLADDLNEDDLDENLYNPLLAFKAWQADNYDFALFDVCPKIEVPGYHAKLKYAGTPDIETADFIIDLKSRKCNPGTDSLQLMFYDHMTGKGDRQHYVLELKQDASYIFTRLNVTAKQRKDCWSKCRFLLDYHNMGEEIKRWKKT